YPQAQPQPSGMPIAPFNPPPPQPWPPPQPPPPDHNVQPYQPPPQPQGYQAPPQGYGAPPVIASPQAMAGRPLPPGYAGGPQLQNQQPQQPMVPRPTHSEDVPEQGFWVERLKGLKMLGAGAGLLLLNVGSLIFLEQYYIITTVIMLPLFFGGGWQVVFGDEYDDRTHEIVWWKRIGFYGSIGFGLLCGVGLLVLLNM
ncbi:MAG: hypothetical protein KC492_30155, partial [Myxococcales bacterium]|nr:hypothetical protein [Myxococcales bacterium]